MTAPSIPEPTAASGTGSVREPGKSALRLVLRLVVTILCLGLLFRALGAGELLERVRSLVLGRPGTWALALLAFLVLHAIGVLKWRVHLALAGARLAPAPAARAYGLGLFANLCLPSIVGGDVLRATRAARTACGSWAAVLLGSVLDRIADLVALLGLALLGALAVPGSLEALETAPASARHLALVVLVGLLLGLAAGALLLSPWRLLAGPRSLVRARLRLLRAVRTALQGPGRAVLGGLLALGMQSGFVLVNAWLASHMGLALELRLWFLAWPLAKLAGMVPVSLGGIGVREVALAGFLRPFGVDAAPVVAVSLVWELVLVAGGLLAGAAALAPAGRRGEGSA